jgi:hypothetical protein
VLLPLLKSVSGGRTQPEVLSYTSLSPYRLDLPALYAEIPTFSPYTAVPSERYPVDRVVLPYTLTLFPSGTLIPALVVLRTVLSKMFTYAVRFDPPSVMMPHPLSYCVAGSIEYRPLM